MVKKRTPEEDERNYEYNKLSMSWYGFASPVGIGIGLVGIGLFIWLLHLAALIGGGV